MSLHTLIRELLDDDHEIDDASDIPTDMRAQIIRAWRETASPVEVAEAFLNPADDNAELLLEAIGHDTSWIAGGDSFSPGFKHLIDTYWWRQITWYVEAAIMEVKAEHELTALIAKEERAEQQSEWNRDRYADAKEFAE